jgi:hypothetical protein
MVTRLDPSALRLVLAIVAYLAAWAALILFVAWSLP